MRPPFALVISHLVAITAFAQPTAAIRLHGGDDHNSCLAASNVSNLESTVCGPSGTIPLGSTIRLLVLHRRFLTDYTLHFDEVTKPESPYARAGELRAVVLKPVVAAQSQQPAVIHKSSISFLEQVLDVTTGSDPIAELERESAAIELERWQVSNAIDAFREKYTRLVESGPVADCAASVRPRTGQAIEACLHAEYDRAIRWSPPPPNPVQDEQSFRTLLDSVESLFADARNFGQELAAADLRAEERAIESSIAAYESDFRAFESNLQSALGAVFVLRQYDTPAGAAQASLQLRAQLRSHLGSVANAAHEGGKSAPDDAEINAFLDHYLLQLSKPSTLQRFWRGSLEAAITRFQRLPAQEVLFRPNREAIRAAVDRQLPTLVSRINH